MMEKAAAKMRKMQARARGEELENDDEQEEDDVKSSPKHQVLEYLISTSRPGIIDCLRIKGRNVVLPNGYIVIMPTVMETTEEGDDENSSEQ